MLSKLKKHWQELEQYPPGERFQRRNRRRREQRKRSGRSLRVGGGLLLIVLGLMLLFVPGPGTIVALIGLALLAQESMFVARWLDWMELRGRRVASFIANHWAHTSSVIRGLIVLAGVAVAGGAVWAAYVYFLR